MRLRPEGRKIEGQPVDVKTLTLSPPEANVQLCLETDFGLT